MTPIAAYNEKIAERALRDDPAQRAALGTLETLFDQLNGYRPKSNWLLSGLFGQSAPRPKGLYIYGGVGRGKSMLMDMFFANIPSTRKERVHFHAFMQAIHADMHTARQKGVEDAIRPVAQNIIARTDLLCLDEMQITDITDAMIVGRLFEFLFDAGVIVVTTSNRHPDALYKDGLNRSLFLPFIEQIKARLTLHNLDSETDHRQNRIAGEQVYFSPLDAAAKAGVDRLWDRLADSNAGPMEITHKTRKLTLPKFSNGVAMASFTQLCAQPLGPGDYLKIAENLRVLILTDIPELTRDNANEAKRFVTLIDALYEAQVKLIASAAAVPEALYPTGTGAFEFERTASRLREMQSAEWGT